MACLTRPTRGLYGKSSIDGIEHASGPVEVIRPDDHNGEAVPLTLKPDPFGVVDVQVDAEGRWKL